jgi:hypothetical protein
VVIDGIAQSAQNSYAAAISSAVTNPTYSRTLGTHASGGTIPMTEPYSLVGEQGPEIIHAPGMAVVPAMQTAAIMGGNGGDTFNLSMPITVNDTLSDARIEALTAQFNAQLKALSRTLQSAGRNQARALGR